MEDRVNKVFYGLIMVLLIAFAFIAPILLIYEYDEILGIPLNYWFMGSVLLLFLVLAVWFLVWFYRERVLTRIIRIATTIENRVDTVLFILLIVIFLGGVIIPAFLIESGEVFGIPEVHWFGGSFLGIIFVVVGWVLLVWLRGRD